MWTRTALLALLAVAASAADWPQWGGLAHDSATTENISTNWPANGPRELWRAELGRGHAPVAVSRGRVVALGNNGTNDTVWCFDAGSGELQWRHDYPSRPWLPKEPERGAFGGPHAPATIHDGRVYTLSRNGHAKCLELATGHLVWERQLAGTLPECGLAGGPLLVGGKLFYNAGKAGTALAAAGGEVLWQSGTSLAGYAPPTFDGKRLYIFGAAQLFAIEPDNGRVLWERAWPTAFGANCTAPVSTSAGLLISAAYDRGAGLLEPATGNLIWTNTVLKSHCSPIIQHQGHLYGFDGYLDDTKNTALVCLQLATGKQCWRQTALSGQLIRAHDKLVLLLTNGQLLVADANPQQFVLRARATLFGKYKTSVPPVLADGKLYCRSPQGRLVCLDAAQ